jgi:hypothetical protein
MGWLQTSLFKSLQPFKPFKPPVRPFFGFKIPLFMAAAASVYFRSKLPAVAP